MYLAAPQQMAGLGAECWWHRGFVLPTEVIKVKGPNSSTKGFFSLIGPDLKITFLLQSHTLSFANQKYAYLWNKASKASKSDNKPPFLNLMHFFALFYTSK